MRKPDRYWAESERIAAALAAECEKNRQLRAEIERLEQRVRYLTAPVPEAFRRAFAADDLADAPS